MPVNFPSNPSLNQTYTFTNTTWKWNGIGWEIVYNTRQTGATGATGISGAPGSPGGATGATGPAGPAGSPGGATGATGPAGTPGTIGIDGATGATGPQGPSGSPGSPGGATGATGAQGATGSPGTPGGATGATGAPGPAGSGANVAVRDEGNLVVAAVSSLNFVGAGVAATATGSNVTITISATGNSQFYYTNVAPTNAAIGDRWLDSETLKEFVYANIGAGPQWIEPAGDGGFVGATGPTGAAGSQGATGATGIGATGATGTAGVQGATGTAGAPGSPGTAGATGATGAAGSPGSAGSPGTAGATGATGTAGSPGTAGATGATGVAGGVSYSVTNSGASSYLIAGSSNPALTLVKGFTYYFNVSATGHPFWIKTAQVTGTGSAYSSGVTNNGVDSGIVAFTVPFDAPATLYYICQFHGSMVGTLTVADSAVGATGTAGTPGAAGATGATGTAGTPGAAGATGATGTAGTTGAAGATGATGPAGTTGAAGATGATGPAGTSANISVFDEGNLVTASVSGINFVGPGITANLVSGNVQVSVTATGTGVGGFNFSNAAPATPTVGDRWLNSETLTQYVYINDGDSSQWVEPITRAASSNLTNVSTHILPNSNVTYDLGSSSLRWRDLYLSGNSIILGGATLTASGSAIALPAGSTVGGQNLATGSDVSTGGGPKITNLQVTSNVYVVLDDTAVDTVGGFIKLTGTNFVTGCMVYVGTVPANSTTFVNSTEVRAQLPATAAGTYPVYVVNPDGGTAIRVPGVTFSASPAWQTASNLGEQYDGVLLNLSVVATDATSYTLVSGSLPPGLSLNSNSGVISGTVTGVTNDTVYSFTINAVDPQLQDSPRTFTVTITVSDPYFKLTTLLLSGSAISANTVVRDSSTNNFNMTVYGDARASNFTPYGTGWSVYFDGTGDYITIANNVALQLSNTIPWTIEFWFYANAMSVEQIILNSYLITGTPNYYGVGITLGSNNQAVTTMTYYDGTSWSNIATGLTPGRWYHVAVSYEGSGTTRRFFLDGVLQGSPGTCPASVTNTANPTSFGALSNGNGPFNGYISNARIVKGTAVYTANFTPATTNLTSVANTSLLTCHTNRFLDGSPNNFTITRNGDARVVSFNPFNITNTGVNGSMYFDGTGDYLSTSNPTFAVGTGAFTIEAWVYPFTVSGKVLGGSLASFVDPAGDRGIGVYLDGARIGRSVTGQLDDISTSILPVAYQWNHIALVRENTSTNGVKYYVNGLLGGQGTSAISVNKQQVVIGRQYPSEDTGYLSGYISSVRWTNAAVYTSAFTPPTSPLTAIANTQLLTCQFDQPHNNHTFLDSSSNQFLITRNGNASQGTFSPFSQTGWSVYFDGSYDCIKVASDAAFGLGTGNFTIELWVNFDDYYAPQSRLAGQYTSGNTNGWQIYKNANSYNLIFNTNTADHITYNWSSVATNTWYHIAVVRSGTGTNQTIMYINGVNVATGTCSHSVGANQVVVGGLDWAASYSTKGYISSFRYSNIARTIVVPTVPYSSDANTLVLTCQSNRFIELSASRSITIAETPKIQAFSPFAATAVYSPVTHGGSMYLDGTGDDLSIATNTAFTDLPGDWTIECWFYSTSTSNQMLAGTSTFNTSGYFLELNYTAAGRVSFVPVPWSNRLESSSAVFTNYTWNHIAYVRSGTTVTIYVNGTSVVSGTRSVTSNSQPLTIGQAGNGWDARYYFNGYISNFRVVKGTAIYTTNFTLPTTPLTATTNTQLLLNFTDAAILDSTGRTVIETVADAKTSSVVTKFTGGSMYFDGTGDWVEVKNKDNQAFNFGSGNFTIEGWYNVPNASTQYALVGKGPSDADDELLILLNNGTYYIDWGGGQLYMQGGSYTANAWHHFALVRLGTDFRLYHNGNSAVSATLTAGYSFTNNYTLKIGSGRGGSYAFNGYINDLRITQGYARYTANFTTPTIPARLK